MIKPDSRILDSTSGNRTMWSTKESEHILWIDVEEELSTPPDRVLDCTKTDFKDKQFHTIFFDPPHSFGRTKNTGIHQSPSKEFQKQKWGSFGSYYGFDKYPTKRTLLSFINKAQKEFHRILMDDGILWFKWGEIHTTWGKIKPFFSDWDEMMKFEVAFQGKSKGCRTWWICLMKNNLKRERKEE